MGAFGVEQALSACFVNGKAICERLGLKKALLPAMGTRRLGKSDMLHNAACPSVRVDLQTFDAYVDGEIATCAPARVLPLAQRYILR